MSTQYVLIVLAVNSDQFQILWSTHSYSSRLFLCALAGMYYLHMKYKHDILFAFGCT